MQYNMQTPGAPLKEASRWKVMGIQRKERVIE
jgi:hypothetical protein